MSTTRDMQAIMKGDLDELRSMSGGECAVNVAYIDRYPHYARLQRAGLIKPVRLTFDDGRHGEVFLYFIATDEGKIAASECIGRKWHEWYLEDGMMYCRQCGKRQPFEIRAGLR